MRVFLDTNVLVSAFAARGICTDLLETVIIEHELLVGRAVLAELERVLRTKVRVPAARCDEIVRFVTQEATTTVDEAQPAEAPVDPDDRRVLGEAIAASAEVFVTGDAAVVELQSVGGMRVLTPRQFWEELRER